MKHDTDLDQLLRQALSPKEEPDYWLNQKILKKAKETEEMSKKYHKRLPVTALIAIIALSAGSFTAFAAWKYLTPDKVAEIVEDKGLTAAFQSENAIAINESQEYGNYKITFLGVVSGKNLSYYVENEEVEGLRKDATYVVTAIENKDGTPRPATSDENYGEDPFFVSPLIKGQDPNQFNLVTMGGGYTEIIQDGVQYRITESDNVEIFADRTLYLAVNSGTFFDGDAYKFDKTSGEITRNESYSGVNALFDLPLDKSKANKEAAEAYLKELENGKEDSETEEREQEKDTSFVSQVADQIANWEEADLEENSKIMENLTQVLTPDKEGYFTYSYQIGEEGMSSSATLLLDSVFENHKIGMSKQKQIINNSDEKEVYIETFTLNEDGTVTLKVYQYTKKDKK
ncbi:MAG: DUF4179 domain-containing protein [Lachnospiraceae bacterium]